jgi:hypothetical protein
MNKNMNLEITANEANIIVMSLQNATVAVKDAPVVLALIEKIVEQHKKQHNANDQSS